jgi:NADPH:quinone reductase-like Zn-dependent oxidoreductase
MKAINFTRYGKADQLSITDRDTPNPGPNQILIKVTCSSTNAMDHHITRGVWLVRLKTGLFRPGKRYNTLGADIAGTVVKVGEKVTRFEPGNRVFGDIFMGGFAEYCLAKEDEVHLIPLNVSFEQAAALPVAGMTAMKAIRDIAEVKPGNHVLINGASGGVGSFCIQFAKYFGATVTAVCSGKNTEMVKSLGADFVIDYTTEDFCKTPFKYDHVIDVTGNRKPKELLRLTKKDGLCVVIGMTTFFNLFRFMLHPSKQIKVVQVKVSPEVLNDLANYMAAGSIKSHITQRFTLDETADALTNMATRRVCGKQVIINSAENTLILSPKVNLNT